MNNENSSSLVTESYIENNYEFIHNLKDDGSVALIRNIVDGSFYVRKVKTVYDKHVYETLHNNHITGTPTIYEMYENSKGLVIIEEFLNGTLLSNYTITDNSSSKDKETIISEIFIYLTDILEELHRMDPPIIHRDIKPENIMLCNGKPVLLDFNIAREFKGDGRRDTLVMGTPTYAAPEQFGFSESDPRTDIYALGMTFKYLTEKLEIKTEKTEAIIAKSTAFDPKERYNNMQEFRIALKSRSGNSYKVTLKKYALPGFRRKNPLFMLIALVAYTFWAYMIIGFDMGEIYYPGVYGVIYGMLGNISLIIGSLFVVLFSFDYLGIKKKFFKAIHIDKKNAFIRALVMVFINILVIFCIFWIYTFLVAFICEPWRIG